jgi:hypothetical protein
MELQDFVLLLKKLEATRTTPPYNQPGEILTIGGMKKPGTVLEKAAKESLRDPSVNVH